MKQKTLISLAENQLRQQLLGGVLVSVTLLMVFMTFGLVRADTDQTNLSFNVTAGSFTIVNVPTSMQFAAQAFGVSNNILGNEEIDSAAVVDYRGNSQAWSVALNANNLQSGSDHISAYRLNAYPSNGDVTNVENADTNQVAQGASGFLAAAGVTLINGSTAADGVFRYDNGVVRLTISGTEVAGTYAAIMLYTLS